jgi:hypothetical protein
MSNEAFKRNFAALLQRAGEKAELVTRKVILELHSSMVLKSPVDTGRFRANWQVGDRTVNLTTTVSTDPDGNGAISRAAAIIERLDLGGVIYLTNSLPYSYRLEHGGSQQAPQGMVKLTVLEYSGFLAKAIARSKGST